MSIRQTDDQDLDTIKAIHKSAFGQDEEAQLTEDLLGDPSAKPLLSLLAVNKDQPLGHILFTKVAITEAEETVSASILAPLAVMPEVQGHGIGSELVRQGLFELKNRGADLVFVFGDPAYYNRFGFHPAGAYELSAPYPIQPEYTDGWMVQELKEGVIGKVHGRIKCAEMLSKPEYWVV